MSKKKEKDNKIVIVIVVIALAVLLMFTLVFGGITLLFGSNNKKSGSFVYEGINDRELINKESVVLTSYDEYEDILESDKLKEKDFKNNNYVLFKVMFDSCSESNLEPTNYEIKGDNIFVQIMYDASCGVCAPSYMYYLLKVDKTITDAKVDITYVARNKPDCDPNVSYKPMIYLYPEKETSVTVKVGYENKLTTTYPKYTNGWKVTASPNGDLHDELGKYYYGLYWEGINNLDVNFEDGFVVEKEDLIEFLEEKLSLLGLNAKERNEFIVYWLPILEQNEFNLIRFESMKKINEEMPLEIVPKPDTVIRVLMEYQPINKVIDVKPQTISKVSRNGFTVVEWGGTLIK